MPAEQATKVEPQAEADAKMVDLPDSGPAIDVELPTKTEKTINPDPEPEVGQEEVKVEETASEGDLRSGSDTISNNGVPALFKSIPLIPSKSSCIDLPASSSRCALVMFIIFSPSSVKIFIEPFSTTGLDI